MIYLATAEQMLRQMAHAHEDMADLEAYAISLGCSVVGDEITCHTDEQWTALDAYTRKRLRVGETR